MHLIFILIFIFIVLSVLGKIAKAAKTVNTTAKKARRGTFNPLDGLGKVFNASTRNEAWMKAAGDLGLSFIRPSTMYDNPSIAGRINGFEIYVTMERDPDQTVYRITFPKSIDIGFLAMRDKALTMLNRQFSGRKRLEKILNLLPDTHRGAESKSRRRAGHFPLPDKGAVEETGGAAGVPAAGVREEIDNGGSTMWLSPCYFIKT